MVPLGISFYSLKALGYCLDVYYRRIEPTKNLLGFFCFIAFFPQIIAGPIDRAGNLLPQFLRPRTFEYALAVDGLRQMLWGFFKKIVIADNCANFASQIFENYDSLPASAVVLGALYFTIQIYADFSGYSDIAIGSAKILGFRSMVNFSVPYFSRDIAEFWRRWHISLTSWFRDYVYIPLGGNRAARARVMLNICIVFLLSGLWHGSGWTFIFWGALHAAYFVFSGYLQS